MAGDVLIVAITMFEFASDPSDLGWGFLMLVGPAAAILYGWRGLLWFGPPMIVALVVCYAARDQFGTPNGPVGFVHKALEVIGITVIVAFLTERNKQQSMILGQLRRQHELILHAAGEGIFGLDQQARFTFVNPSAAQLFGSDADALLGQDLRTVVVHAGPGVLGTTDDGVGPIQAALQDGAIHSVVDGTFRRCDGGTFPVEYVSTPILEEGRIRGAVVTFKDTTEQKRAEMQLRQAQKLESVGRLAAGIAHEINTPIQFVGDNLRFLKSALAEGKSEVATERDGDTGWLQAEVPLAIEQSLDGVQRIAAIVGALSQFAHPDSREQVVADLNAALRSTITVAISELRAVAEIVTDLGDLPPVRCHVGRLNQVFLNLLVNAAHAVDDAGRAERGFIRVSSRHEGDQAVVRIEDNGCGIPESIRSQIFDPFVTTRDVGRGTGQGLALARSIIVDKHAGSIDFSSSVGQGTVFVIRLPVSGDNLIDTRVAA
jgi:two-component system NtrC family sensor kinase